MDITIHATPTLDGTFAKLEAGGAGVVQEPTEQPYDRSSSSRGGGRRPRLCG